MFLVYQEKPAVEVNKRLRVTQLLFKQAKAKLEATKDAQGAYHVGEDRTTYHIEDHHLYPVISDILSAECIRAETEG